MGTKEFYRGLDIDKVVRGLNQHNIDCVKKLIEYVHARRRQMGVEYALAYADILIEIKKIFGTQDGN